ncbi:MAG: ATP-binding protein [Pseudomonadota bacterium]
MQHPLDTVGGRAREEALRRVDERLARLVLPGALLQPVAGIFLLLAVPEGAVQLRQLAWIYLIIASLLSAAQSGLALGFPGIYASHGTAWRHGIHGTTLALMATWSMMALVVIASMGLEGAGAFALLITGAIVAALNTVFAARRWMAWTGFGLALSGPAIGLALANEMLMLAALLLYGAYFVVLSITRYREYWDHTLGTVRMSRSVAELERVNRELQVRSEEAVTAAASRSQFIANTSHELRTPLHGILGNAELLLARAADERSIKLAKAIFDAGRSLLHLVNDVLELSRVEAGQMRIDIDAEEPRKIVNAVRETVERLAEPKGLDVEALVDKPVPRLLLMDGERYKQILMNIAGNAVKFTQRGKVRIALGYHAELDPPRLETYVSDTGPGIPPGKEATIFDDFVQLDSGMDRRHEGTGLGLAICKRLVESMGGEIGLESVPNAGSTFWFSIPVRPTSSVDHKARSSGRIIAARERHGRGSRILIVDDNESNRQLAVEQVQHLGHEADAASGADEAFSRLEQFAYDLVLLDCQMPEVDGYEVARRIREMRGNVNHLVPIVAVTANAMPEERNRCLQAGMDDYMSKPLTLKMLEQTVDVWIGGVEGNLEPSESVTPDTDSDWSAGPDPAKQSELEWLTASVGAPAVADILDEFEREFDTSMVSLVDALTAGASDRALEAAIELAGHCRDMGLSGQARGFDAVAADLRDGDTGAIPESGLMRDAVLQQIQAVRGTLMASAAEAETGVGG